MASRHARDWRWGPPRWQSTRLELLKDGEVLDIAQEAEDAAIICRAHGDAAGAAVALLRRQECEVHYVDRLRRRYDGMVRTNRGEVLDVGRHLPPGGERSTVESTE